MKRNFSSLSQLASSAKFETKEIENRTEAKGSDQESSSSGSDDGSSDSDSSSSSDEEADAPAQPARRSRRKSILSALSKDGMANSSAVAQKK